MKFTKEEISLCKQVAEKHRKEIGKGDWWYRNEGNYPAEIVLVQGSGSADIFNDINKHMRLHSHGFPLWTIPDCLEFLRERGWYITACYQSLNSTELNISHVKLPNWKIDKHILMSAGTFLKACLRAVLAVLKG